MPVFDPPSPVKLSCSRLQDSQHLMVDFVHYPAMLAKLLSQCDSEPHAYLAILVMHTNGTAQLDLIQNMEYKFVEVLSLSFVTSSEDVIRRHVTARFNDVAGRLAAVEAQYTELSNLVSEPVCLFCCIFS